MCLVLQLYGYPSLRVHGQRVTWFRPASLAELLILCNKYPRTPQKGAPQNRVIMGNTEIGEAYKYSRHVSLPNDKFRSSLHAQQFFNIPST